MKSKNYINLALIERENTTKQEVNQFTTATIHGNIDDIMKSKQAMNISQIAQLPDGSQPKCILVEGAPGVGKSTFAWKLCRKWGKGRLLQQYQMVVLLSLRDKSIRTARKISSLFQYYRQHIQQAAVEEIQDTGGKGVLLLFEGYDELPEELRTKSENSVFLNIITGRELPEATVLITSRPWASEFLHLECKGRISQHIEILGFTKDNIQSYLESTILDKPSLLDGLKNYISCYPHINSLMYIPLHSAIVVEVYRNSRKDETLVPKTITELYSSLFRSLLLRHLLDHPLHGKNRRWKVCSFDDLPQDVYQQLCELGRIAYEGILHDQQVIFSDLPEDFETLGLMQCAPELYADEGTAVSYNFLHLTVQEYLAAFHLSQQPVEEQIDHFRMYKQVQKWETTVLYKKQRDNHFHMVLKFLCGIRKFRGYLNEVLSTSCVSFDGLAIMSDILPWLFETQDNDVPVGSESDVEVGSDSNRESDDEAGSDSNRECDIEAGSDSNRESDDEAGSDSNRECDIEAGSDSNRESDDEAGSDSNRESDDEAGSDSNRECDIEAGSDSNRESDDEAGSDSNRECDIEAGSNSNHECDIEAGSDSSCESNVEASSDSNCECNVEAGSNFNCESDSEAGSDFNCESDVEAGTDFNSKASVVSGMNTDCKLGDDSSNVVREVTFDNLRWLFEAQLDKNVTATLLGSSVIQLHRRWTRVTPFDWFVLGYCVSHSNCNWKIDCYEKIWGISGFVMPLHIGDEGVEMLVRGAMEEETHCTGGISEMDLSKNNITSEGVKHLLKFPKQLKNKLETLNLSENNLDPGSCSTLAHLIPNLPHLKKLNLSHNPNIGQGMAVPLITSMTAHNSLEQLLLDKTGISIEDCQALRELLSSSTSLKLLTINALSPEAVELIISGLHHNTKLIVLNITDSHFSLQNTISLASVLRTNHTLFGLNLSNCNIDSDGACQLASALCTNGTLLKTIWLCNNLIGVAGATAFAKMLLKNKSLKELKLLDDSIGEKGTQKLINSLSKNSSIKVLWLPVKYMYIESQVDSRVKYTHW